MSDETPAPRPFGLMLRRPGDVANPDADWGQPDRVEGIYVAPDFTTRHAEWDAAGTDPRNYVGGENDWALSLPHNCGEWTIDYGPREEVLAAALRFRAELDQAIAALGGAPTGTEPRLWPREQRIPTAVVGQPATGHPEWWQAIDEYRQAVGREPMGAVALTAAEVNEAIDWWNRRAEQLANGEPA